MWTEAARRTADRRGKRDGAGTAKSVDSRRLGAGRWNRRQIWERGRDFLTEIDAGGVVASKGESELGLRRRHAASGLITIDDSAALRED